MTPPGDLTVGGFAGLEVSGTTRADRFVAPVAGRGRCEVAGDGGGWYGTTCRGVERSQVECGRVRSCVTISAAMVVDYEWWMMDDG